MPVDAKRVHAVFEMVARVTDAAQRAAILDRECGADGEMRQRVEDLLRARQPVESHAIQSDGTLVVDPAENLAATAEHGPGQVGAPKDEPPLSLDFLEPAEKPGSLG